MYPGNRSWLWSVAIGLARRFSCRDRETSCVTISTHCEYNYYICVVLHQSAACAERYLWGWALMDQNWMACCGWSTQSSRRPSSLPFYSCRTGTRRTEGAGNTTRGLSSGQKGDLIRFNESVFKCTFAMRIPVTQRSMVQASSQHRYLMYWDSFWIWGCYRETSRRWGSQVNTQTVALCTIAIIKL